MSNNDITVVSPVNWQSNHLLCAWIKWPNLTSST